MKKLDVLLLGWEFPPLVAGDSGVACYELAKELAAQVNLSLILPKADPQYVLSNVELTGLNNINLQETPVAVSKPDYQVFGHQAVPQPEIKPYGAPTYTGQEELVTPAYEQPGEAEAVGELAGERTDAVPTEPVETLNIFGQTDFTQLDYNTQVIHFARYATRLASQKHYDVIYAYDWMTYLAGIELKLVSGKLLVVHVQSLCEERGGPDSKGWAYEIEKQALEKADLIIAQSESLVNAIETRYDIPASKIRSLYRLDEPFTAEEKEEEETVVTATNEPTIAEPTAQTAATPELAVAETESEPLDWQQAAENMVTVFQKLLQKPQLTDK
ncbi:glycosyltransferase [Adhaeribacter rhizoryzae]|uniref:Glycosyltransferase n=1 Tax=Adhaeribacter rhizoryzae TaxID=2607907 RepID=A0A5M6DMG5_9BACT|nr:glycosyltransferase [Adhaeribacter rhizoryzae]KAA5548737.1 glycosyltransferase [Adhaeribacter rhizoryzae]